MKDYRMPLVISFVLKLKGDERIDGDGLQYGHVFLLSSVWKGSMEENGADECGERWNGQDDFLILYTFLFI